MADEILTREAKAVGRNARPGPDDVADAELTGGLKLSLVEAGVRRIHTRTGVVPAGDPQHPDASIDRYGFPETRVRQTWAPPWT